MINSRKLFGIYVQAYVIMHRVSNIFLTNTTYIPIKVTSVKYSPLIVLSDDRSAQSRAIQGSFSAKLSDKILRKDLQPGLSAITIILLLVDGNTTRVVRNGWPSVVPIGAVQRNYEAVVRTALMTKSGPNIDSQVL